MNNTNGHTPQRKLSLLRIVVALILLGVSISVAIIFIKEWQPQRKIVTQHKPWFAAYADATATPLFAFEQLGTTASKNVVLSFIVASSSDPCTPSWGNAYTLDQASVVLDLDRRIARLRQQGGNVAISFGGQRNNELAISCTDSEKLFHAYQSIIERYNIDTIDLDLEGNGLTDTDAMKRRAVSIATLQKTMRLQKKSLAVWLTLPVSPQGLTPEGTNAVAQFLANKVDIAGINAMTMDYGESRDAHDTMEQASEKALLETHRQLGILYKQAGINLNSASLWAKIGATVMIGQNDFLHDVFTLDDAKKLNAFALSVGIGRLSMWSANRDIQCGDNYVNTQIVSDSCSGVKENKLQFATLLSNGFTGDFSHNAQIITTQDADTNIQQPDDPATSPYQIWSETGVYLQGTKVVWHRNVYQAKWWTQGDLPDNPVLQSWQTPWQLIGPVLPGEKPVPQPKLPTGTYPQWSGTQIYDVGMRVLFNGVPYQAKWWNQGYSPAASSANQDNSPWQALTQEQVNELIQTINASKSALINRVNKVATKNNKGE